MQENINQSWVTVDEGVHRERWQNNFGSVYWSNEQYGRMWLTWGSPWVSATLCRSSKAWFTCFSRSKAAWQASSADSHSSFSGFYSVKRTQKLRNYSWELLTKKKQIRTTCKIQLNTYQNLHVDSWNIHTSEAMQCLSTTERKKTTKLPQIKWIFAEPEATDERRFIIPTKKCKSIRNSSCENKIAVCRILSTKMLYHNDLNLIKIVFISVVELKENASKLIFAIG